MTDDDKLIARAVEASNANRQLSAVDYFVGYLEISLQLRAAVARHLLSRDPECVRVPMKGTVT